MAWYVNALKELSHEGMTETDLSQAFPGREVQLMSAEEVGAIMV